MLHGPGGLLSTPGLGPRHRRKRKWGTRLKDKQIKGNLYRSDVGRFTAGSGPSSDAPVVAVTPKRGAKKPKKTDAERAAERDEKKRASGLAKATERAQNRQKILEGLNIAPDGQAALGDLADGEQPRDPQAIERGGFEAAGLVERAQDGSFRMTASGRAAMAAAAAGDAGRAGSIISSARDRVSTRVGKQQAAQTKRDATAARREQVAARRAKKPKRKPAAKPSDERAATVARNLERLSPTARSMIGRAKSFVVFKDYTGAYRWIARTTTAYRDRDNEIISEAALDQDSQRMMTTKQFGPLRYWHIGHPDPFDQDRPWGPGIDIGDCDYSVVIGRTRIESGTFRDPQIAQKVARQADQYELSPGFFHPLDQPGADGVFNAVRSFERSIVPIKYGRASNLFTGLAVKEQRMNIDEMEKRFKTAISDLGLDAQQAAALGQQLVATEKTAAAQGIAFKSGEVPVTAITTDAMPGQRFKSANGEEYIKSPSEVDPTGAYYAVKAAPPIEEMIEEQADDPIEAMAEDVIEPEEEMAGDYIGDMSWDEFAAKLGELLAPVLKMQDMVKAMGDAHAELKTMYGGVAQKDDARAQEIATLKASLKDLTDKLAQIEGDQPATILPDEVAAALKSDGPTQAQEPDRAAITQAINDPTRPFAGWGIQTFPELYKNGENS